MKWIVLILFGTVGAGALWGGLSWGLKRYQLMSRSVSASGRVVDQHVHEAPAKRVGAVYRQEPPGIYPIVEFETREGETVRFQGTTGGQGKPVLETGAEVTVAYDPLDPSDAMIAEFKQAWLGPLVLSVAGAVFLAFGVSGYFLIAASDRRSPPIDDLFEKGRMEMQQQLEHTGDAEQER